MTKIIATHDLNLVADTCSKIALLDSGRRVTIGKTACHLFLSRYFIFSEILNTNPIRLLSRILNVVFI